MVPGRKPLVKLVPPSMEVANPMSDAPPPKKRPTWKADTRVLPEANVSGSTSVLCWLVALLNGSLLSCKSLVLASAVPWATSRIDAAAPTTRMASRRFMFPLLLRG